MILSKLFLHQYNFNNSFNRSLKLMSNYTQIKNAQNNTIPTIRELRKELTLNVENKKNMFV